MDTNNTNELLKECDSGSKMAVSAIDEVIDKVKDKKFKQILIDFKDKHSVLGNEIHSLLSKNNESEKDPNPVAKGMAWMKTNMKMAMEESDKTIADLMTDGCNMGIKSLYRYLNQYKDADEKAKKLCVEMIDSEDRLRKDISCYL